MREILFRGKTLTWKWVEGAYYKQKLFYGDKEDADVIITSEENLTFDQALDFAICDSETIGQYTGLTDKNGKKIFEGDIVKDEYSKGQYQYFKIIYDERTYRWETENKYGMFGQLCNVMGECEVIGNIHDNPELLKEKSDDNG